MPSMLEIARWWVPFYPGWGSSAEATQAETADDSQAETEAPTTATAHFRLDKDAVNACVWVAELDETEHLVWVGTHITALVAGPPCAQGLWRLQGCCQPRPVCCAARHWQGQNQKVPLSRPLPVDEGQLDRPRSAMTSVVSHVVCCRPST